MIPAYTAEEYNRAKSRGKLPLLCKQCGETFLQTKQQIQNATRDSQTTTRDFCSNACKYQAQIKQVEVRCLQCGTIFIKMGSQVQKSSHHFCKQSCAATYSNAHKTRGTRRSKLEMWLEEHLKLAHPTWDFHFNRTDAVDAELDIFIPHLRLAFELNGIFHYEPIYGADKLERVHKNDRRKFLACAEAGIELCILDSSKMTYFKPSAAEPFLQIIEGVIVQAESLR